VRFLLINSNRVFEAASGSKELLWQKSALQRSSDTFLAFTLRASELVIADQSVGETERHDAICDLTGLLGGMRPGVTPVFP
jgi:hypothetical protein